MPTGCSIGQAAYSVEPPADYFSVGKPVSARGWWHRDHGSASGPIEFVALNVVYSLLGPNNGVPGDGRH